MTDLAAALAAGSLVPADLGLPLNVQIAVVAVNARALAAGSLVPADLGIPLNAQVAAAVNARALAVGSLVSADHGIAADGHTVRGVDARAGAAAGHGVFCDRAAVHGEGAARIDAHARTRSLDLISGNAAAVHGKGPAVIHQNAAADVFFVATGLRPVRDRTAALAVAKREQSSAGDHLSVRVHRDAVPVEADRNVSAAVDEKRRIEHHIIAQIILAAADFVAEAAGFHTAIFAVDQLPRLRIVAHLLKGHSLPVPDVVVRVGTGRAADRVAAVVRRPRRRGQQAQARRQRQRCQKSPPCCSLHSVQPPVSLRPWRQRFLSSVYGGHKGHAPYRASGALPHLCPLIHCTDIIHDVQKKESAFFRLRCSSVLLCLWL